ncbi:helix-turn-helix transcriptional regulator [Leucobacter weissii]|uniref:Helix-turn-helix transcriptional regulator n=1 Tax=Leucobacter weissii TaxID=1983706 RepID=A0A939MKJ8_9MICO|nr:helix-turn-helix transcriptional regulator [Leucobacter weissii]
MPSPGGARSGGVPRSKKPQATRAVYTISVAAELSGLGVQTLRLYETRGLLAPARTPGGTRRYSGHDLRRLRRISELIEAGVNLAGVREILVLEARNQRLREENARLRALLQGEGSGPG